MSDVAYMRNDTSNEANSKAKWGTPKFTEIAVDALTKHGTQAGSDQYSEQS